MSIKYTSTKQGYKAELFMGDVLINFYYSYKNEKLFEFKNRVLKNSSKEL